MNKPLGEPLCVAPVDKINRLSDPAAPPARKPHATTMKRTILLIIVFALVGLRAAKAQDDSTWEYAVELNAVVQTTAPRITLQWRSNSVYPATGYTVYRKLKTDGSWTFLTSLSGTTLSYADSNAALGTSYEYKVVKSANGPSAYGYINAGVQVPAVDSRGKLLLIVDDTHASALSTELTQLQQNLVGDGWIVIRQDVPRSATVATVKQHIRNFYNADPSNAQAVFVFGHVAVPYSGNKNPSPDFHTDHQGAWTADVYYGDTLNDNLWTDSTVNVTGTAKPWNVNIPGDGKFDQNNIPSNVELAVGRVDLYNMTCFNNKPSNNRDELALLRNYLNKNNAFRNRVFTPLRQGLIRDGWGYLEGDAPAASAHRSFSTMFGTANVYLTGYNGYVPALTGSSKYLFSWGGGGGDYYYCSGVATSDELALNDIQVVFAMHFGSYFADFDNESNFLRAGLGSGDCLAVMWSGRPHWFLHHMSLGDTVGYSTRLSQNNNAGLYQSHVNSFAGGTHISLMGDPTLRLFNVIPVGNLQISGSGPYTLSWTGTSESGLQGYYVYRSSSPAGPFTRITPSVVSSPFTDNSVGAGTYTYMVKAVKLETSSSGTYYNTSQGRFVSTTVIPPTGGGNAWFISSDTVTKGSWIGTYGSEGTNVIGNYTAYPSYVTVTPSGKSDWVWSDPTSDVRALQKASGSGRIAATWYSPSSFTVNFNVAAGQRKRVSFYFLDWDNAGRSQTVEMRRTSDNALLDSRSVTLFSQGVYINYDITNNVTLHVIRTAGPNCVLNGIFFGGGGDQCVSAAFLTTDTTTKGTWKGTYGSSGYNVIGNAASHPGITITPSGKADYTWADPTSDVRALQKANHATDRISSVWYATPSFTVDINLGCTERKVSLYCLDWDQVGRVQQVEIINIATGAVLDNRSLSSFGQGKYLVYRLKGDLRIRFTNQGPNNAILNGIFIDP